MTNKEALKSLEQACEYYYGKTYSLKDFENKEQHEKHLFKEDEEALATIKADLEMIEKYRELLQKIYALVSGVLVIKPNAQEEHYRPVKNTSRNDCYKIVWELEKIFGVIKQ